MIQITAESMETLNAGFDLTDKDMFMNSTAHPDEQVHTVTDYISFNSDMILPEKTINSTKIQTMDNIQALYEI